jgi:GNAT superfamily N-acetyltransferase
MIEVIQAQEHIHAPHIRELFWEYLHWANARLNEEYGIDFDIATMIEGDMVDLAKFLPPGGRLLLARSEGQMAGIACMKKLTEDIGEIKRMYVRPAVRRQGIGRALVSRLLAEARAIGYRRIRLDSTRFMKDAHALYRSFGFHEIEPYEGSEIPKEFQAHWVFMEREL